MNSLKFEFGGDPLAITRNKLIRSQCILSLTSENNKRPYGFLMFSGGRERVHWERMG